MRAAVGLFVVFAVSVGIAYVIMPDKPNAGFKDSAAVLAFVSLAAVTIERIIEGMFALLAGPLGEWWPFAEARKEFDRFEKETNGVLTDVVNTTIEELQKAKTAGRKTKDEIERIDELIAGITADQKRLAERYGEVTTKLAPGSSRLARVSEINAEITKKLGAVHEASAANVRVARNLLTTATEVADRASLILSSFTDNPARRIASLVLGASLGMLVAGAVGLNLFIATLVTDDGNTTALPPLVAGSLGVLFTGIVLGLGSAPAHEVVKSLQSYRDSRTAPESVTTALTQTTTGAGLVPAGLLEMPAIAGQAAPAQVDVPVTVRKIRRTG